jgi:hypothetical protein
MLVLPLYFPEAMGLRETSTAPLAHVLILMLHRGGGELRSFVILVVE